MLASTWRERVEAAAYLDAWRATIDAAAKSPVADTPARLLGETFQQALARNGVRTVSSTPDLVETWRRANVAALEIRKTDEELAARAAKP